MSSNKDQPNSLGKIDEDRLMASQAAKTVLELAVSEAATLRDETRFWERIREYADEYCDSEPTVLVSELPKMTDEESRAFDREPIPYGQFNGMMVKDIPLDRLTFYADQRFTDRLRAYLRSDRIQRELNGG